MAELSDAADDVDMADADGSGGEAAARAAPLSRAPLLPGRVQDLYPNIHRIRGQHRRNLLALLTHGLLEADYCTAAGVAGTLLAALPPGAEQMGLATKGGEELVRLLHVLWASVEVLLQHGAPQDQVKRLLRRVAVLLADTPALRQTAQLELILHTWKHGEPAAVLELVAHEEGKGYVLGAGISSPFAFHLGWITALIKHKEWLQHVLATSSQQQSQSQLPATNANLLGPLQLPFAPLHGLGTPAPGLQQPRSQLVSPAAAGSLSQDLGDAGEASGAAAGDAAAELDLSLQCVLRVAPGASHPALLMCHMLVLTGRHSEAVAVAAAAAAASGMAPELLSLWALLAEPAALAAAAAAAAARAAAPVAEASASPAAGVQGRNAASELGRRQDSGDSGADTDMEELEPGSGPTPGSQQQQQQQQQAEGVESPIAAATAGAAGLSGSAEAAAAAEGAAAVHSYVAVCEEVVRVDPWSHGAVEGLIQASGHCHSCTAAAVRGLLCHLDAVLPDSAWTAAASAAQLWPVLAGLLLQLAVAAAATAKAAGPAATPPATGRPSGAAAAAGGSGDEQQQDEEVGAAAAVGTTGAAATGGSGEGLTGPSCPWKLWQQLQRRCFAPRQHWWQAAGLCSTQELTAATRLLQAQASRHAQQQDTGAQAQQLARSGQQNASQMHASPANMDASPAQGPLEGDQHQTGFASGRGTGPGSSGGGRPGSGGVGRLLGSAAGGMSGGMSRGGLSGGPSSGLRLPLSQYHFPSTQQQAGSLWGGDSSQPQSGAEGGIEEGSRGMQEGGGLEASQQQQQLGDSVMVLCSKAMALGFVLGPHNAFSTAALAAFAPAGMQPVPPAPAVAAGVSAGAAPAALSQGAGAEAGGSTVLQAVAEASGALQDGLNLTMQLQRMQAQQDFQQRQQQQQPQQAPQPKRLFGHPTAEFGALLDMPDAWWAAFPHKRRLSRQQQQQQGQEDMQAG